MHTPTIWMENIPRKLNFIPHLRNLAYSPHFNLISEPCCQALQFCFRLSSQQTEYLDFSVDGKEYSVGFPHLMIKKYGQQIKFKNASSAEVIYFSYLPECLSFFEGRGLPDYFVAQECCIPFQISSLLKKIHYYTTHLGYPESADKLDIFCFTLLSEVILNLNLLDVPQDENSKKIQKIASYLQIHYRECPNFDMLAKRYGFSRRSFIRHWQKYMKSPPSEYIANLRLLEAKRLLKESSLRVVEIASRLGFCDDGYFCRFFRLKTGMTPHLYRKNNS